jgi:uncharacterized cupin superfamily protein
MSNLKITVVKPIEKPWPEFPIPADWVSEGSPDSRGVVSIETCDEAVRGGQWSCTPGKFRWEYEMDELFYLFDGEAEITIEGGESYAIRAGDMVHLPQGIVATWDIKKTVRKVFFLHSPNSQ